MIQPVILCGGKGSRLWPLSRELYPKQYLQIGNKATLFQQTLHRTNTLESQHAPIVICNAEHRFFVAEQMQQLGLEGEIVLEPEGRNTAPAVAISALLQKDIDPLLLVLPADHVIKDQAAFLEAVKQATSLAEKGYLVTFGIVPDRPEEGFGYLHKGEPLDSGFKVASFKEKPSRETAGEYLESGEYFWNSGMFLFKASTFLAELERFVPKMHEICAKTLEESSRDLDFLRLPLSTFADCPSDSIDYAVMEKTDKCAMVSLDASWSDLGSWNAMYDASSKDDDGNVLHGDVVTKDAQGCYLHAETRLLAVAGLKDVVVVETSDAVFVTHKDEAQGVKGIVASLCAESRSEAIHHRKVYRPWGCYESIDQDTRFQVKRITVKPGQVLSLQKHHHRSEHWVVVSGTAMITNGDKEFLLTEDQSTYIPVGTIHRLENPGMIPLELIEIQTGPYLGEDDIVRFEDLYGRFEESDHE